MAKQKNSPASSDNKSSSQQRNQRNNQNAMKKQNSKPDGNHQKKNNKGSKVAGDNKIHYVLAPKKILEKRKEIKDLEKTEIEKSHQKQKQKRNSAFLRRTKKGQPDLGSRMKVLYSQIQKSFESST